MKLRVQIDKENLTSEGFPISKVVKENGTPLATLDVQATKFGFPALPEDIAADFLLIASTVYTIDKLINRGEAEDGWTRQFDIAVPVSAPDLWQQASTELNECISFLTGDRWRFEFSQLSHQLFGKTSLSRHSLSFFKPAAVSLFSGGLDSLVGVIDWLETNPDKKLLLAGHHDKQMAGPLGDQENLLAPLRTAYPQRLQATLVRVGNHGDSPEITLRGRSLLFIAVAVCVASGYKLKGPILLPENGTIALNVPLSPSRRGSCSTRTAHPHYVAQLQKMLGLVGIGQEIVNPLLTKTKGEAVRQCLNLPLLTKLFAASVSCAKSGHKREWKNRSASGCGRCMPCIYRRAALHSAGLDSESYGLDICKGDVDLNATNERGPADMRACVSFLRNKYSENQIKTFLLSNGTLDIEKMDEYSGLVTRAFDEIRHLFRDKARKDIRRMAGIVP
jgi:7-cyano-7-deazaguanine synthase in queuosine biosynthesis